VIDVEFVVRALFNIYLVEEKILHLKETHTDADPRRKTDLISMTWQ
jgi:hypothetical protein